MENWPFQRLIRGLLQAQVLFMSIIVTAYVMNNDTPKPYVYKKHEIRTIVQPEKKALQVKSVVDHNFDCPSIIEYLIHDSKTDKLVHEIKIKDATGLGTNVEQVNEVLIPFLQSGKYTLKMHVVSFCANKKYNYFTNAGYFQID